MAESLVLRLQRALLRDDCRKITPAPDQNALECISSVLFEEEDEERESHTECNKYMEGLSLLLWESGTSLESPVRCQEEVNLQLYSLLLECARATAARNSKAVYELVGEVKTLASPQGGGVERTALFFVNALLARLDGYGPQLYAALSVETLRRRSWVGPYEEMPTNVTDYFANLVILEACKASRRVHIVDYGILYGCQWPWLIKALSELPDGPPRLKITGIHYPHLTNLSQIENDLLRYADEFGVQLEFHPIVSSNWESVQPRCSNLELLVVNCNLRMRHVTKRSGVESPRRLLHDRIRKLRPAVFVNCVVEGNMNLDSPIFMHRFEEAFKYYSTMMEHHLSAMRSYPGEIKYGQSIMERNIVNVVACEGNERVERPEPYEYWDAMAKKSGFEQLPIAPHIVESVKLTWMKTGQSRLEMCDNWLRCGLDDFPYFAMSAWKPTS